MSSILTKTKSVSTPKKQTAAATPPVTDSPGTWRHPHLEEIIRRQDAATFTEKNVRRIAVNVVVLCLIMLCHNLIARMLPAKRQFPQLVWNYARYVYWAVLSIPLFNIGANLLPLARQKDDLADIPLTPSQRKLLGLPPSSAPPTPGSVYSTPPRYSRTPSISGSAGSKRSFSSSPRSPFSNNGSPTPGNGIGNLSGLGGIGSPSSPLLQKAMNGARRSSFGSLGSPGSSLGAGLGATLGTSLGASFSTSLGASTGSFYGGVPDSPSPTPAAAKRSTVGLNNKWLYERGRDRRSSSGNAWLYT